MTLTGEDFEDKCASMEASIYGVDRRRLLVLCFIWSELCLDCFGVRFAAWWAMLTEQTSYWRVATAALLLQAPVRCTFGVILSSSVTTGHQLQLHRPLCTVPVTHRSSTAFFQLLHWRSLASILLTFIFLVIMGIFIKEIILITINAWKQMTELIALSSAPVHTEYSLSNIPSRFERELRFHLFSYSGSFAASKLVISTAPSKVHLFLHIISDFLLPINLSQIDMSIE